MKDRRAALRVYASMVRFAVLVVCLLAACGGAKSTQPSEHRTQGTGDREQGTGHDLSDAGVAVAEVVADAGAPVAYPDAGLVDMGVSQCEMVIARVIACPNFDASIKKELEKKRVELRQLAVNPKNREMLGAACRQLVEEMEEMLRRLSC